MTLKELRAKVNSLPSSLDDAVVILQKDSEGNGYQELGGVDDDAVCPNLDDYDKSIYSRDYTTSDNCMEEEEWEELKNDPSKRVIVLFP